MVQRLRERGDEGFTLVEVLVALLVLATVSVAAVPVLVGGLGTTAEQSRKQTAFALANQAVEVVRAVPAEQLLTGRTSAQVAALLSHPDVAPYVTQDVVDTDNTDPSPAPAATPTVPLTRTQVVGGTPYTVHTAINRCWFSPSSSTCTRTQPSGSVSVVRATVVVTWGSCGSRCRYPLALIVDRQDDPVFRSTTSKPVIVTLTPDIATAGSTTALALTGNDFSTGAVLSTTAAGGGTFGATTVSTNGRQLTSTWTPGVPGTYTLQLVNPDTGRAESTVTVVPHAVANCYSGDVDAGAVADLPVLTNDVPTSGTITITTPPPAGEAHAVPDGSGIRVTTQTSAAFVATLEYTLTVNGQVSAPATVTLRNRSGAC